MDREQRTARGQWGSEGDPNGARRPSGLDPYGMASVDHTAKRYEARGYHDVISCRLIPLHIDRSHYN